MSNGGPLAGDESVLSEIPIGKSNNHMLPTRYRTPQMLKLYFFRYGGF